MRCIYLLAGLNKVQEELLHYPGVDGGVGICGGISVSKMLKFYVKVFKLSYFSNPLIHLKYILPEDRYWSKVLFSTAPPLVITYRSRSQKFYVKVLC